MKVIWEPGDVQAGRRVGFPNRQEQWMIGYDPRSDRDKWLLVSLKDGMLGDGSLSREQLAEHLNKSGDVPIELLPALEWRIE